MGVSDVRDWYDDGEIFLRFSRSGVIFYQVLEFAEEIGNLLFVHKLNLALGVPIRLAMEGSLSSVAAQ